MRRILIALLVVAGLSACSGGSPAAGPTAPADPTAAYQAQILTIARQYAECARANGRPNFPDGALDAQGALTFPGAPKEDLAALEAACGEILQRMPPWPGRQNYTPSAEDMQLLHRFAECFRANGVPEWPDPDPDGTFPIEGTALETEMNATPVSERLRTARLACRKDEGQNPFR